MTLFIALINKISQNDTILYQNHKKLLMVCTLTDI